MNKHIEQYLDSYLKKENTEYAILLTGNWGVGKTYFINRYIENKKTDEPKYKIIYISLFGLKTISEINDEIFEELHPMLSHKGVKFLGGVLRSAVKFGFNFDLVGDGSQETKLNIDLSKTKFFNKDNYENIVFVFDDLERTRIQMPEVLGFINNLCERENLKVIVITDEEKLSNDEYYKNFKEKVIGKSFTISQDNDEFWQDFSNRYKEKLHLNENITTIIKDTFSQHGNGNYRNLNRTTDSYIDFIENIDKKYLKNNNFYTLLTNEFYTLSIRYREKSDISKAFIPLSEEFGDFIHTNLFNKKLWESIILENYSRDNINQKISGLYIFNTEEKPSWQKLQHYRKLSDSDFNKYLEEVLSKFQNNEYNDVLAFLNVVALLLFFAKEGLHNKSVSDIKDKANEHIATNEDEDKWRDINIEPDEITPNYTYGKNPDFIGIYNNLEKSLEKVYKERKNKELIDLFYQGIDYLETENWKDIYVNYRNHGNDGNYRYTPMLNYVSFQEVLNRLGSRYTPLLHLSYFLNQRFREDTSFNGTPLSKILASELPFIEQFIDYLSTRLEDESLTPFDKFKFREILDSLQSIAERLKASSN